MAYLVSDQPGPIPQATGEIMHTIFWTTTFLWVITRITDIFASLGVPRMRIPSSTRKLVISWWSGMVTGFVPTENTI